MAPFTLKHSHNTMRCVLCDYVLSIKPANPRPLTFSSPRDLEGCELRGGIGLGPCGLCAAVGACSVCVQARIGQFARAFVEGCLWDAVMRRIEQRRRRRRENKLNGSNHRDQGMAKLGIGLRRAGRGRCSPASSDQRSDCADSERDEEEVDVGRRTWRV